MVAKLQPPPSMFDLTDTNFAGIVPGDVAIWNGLWWLPGAPAPALHAPTHQFGGVDQVNIAGLPGISAQLALHLADFLNPHAVTWAQVGAIQNAANTVNDTHIDWGVGANQVSADDIPDGAVNAIVTLVQEAAWDAHLIAVNNPHTVTLDQAYDAGATITVDAAGGDLIINLAAATDFKIQDAGADLFVIADTGGLTHTAPAALATLWTLNEVGPWTTDADMTAIVINRTAVLGATNTDRIWAAIDVGNVGAFTVTNPLHGVGFDTPSNMMYGMRFDPILDTDWTGTTGMTFTSHVYGMQLNARLRGDDAATNYLIGSRLVFGVLGDGRVEQCDISGGRGPLIEAYGGDFYGETRLVTLTAGAPVLNAYGVRGIGRGSAVGTQTAYGGYFRGYEADTNYGIYAGGSTCAGYFYSTSLVAIATVFMMQDHLSGACPVLALDQDDISEGFIDFVGSARGVILESVDSVDSCRVEMNGVVRRLALYADA